MLIVAILRALDGVREHRDYYYEHVQQWFGCSTCPQTLSKLRFRVRTTNMRNCIVSNDLRNDGVSALRLGLIHLMVQNGLMKDWCRTICSQNRADGHIIKNLGEKEFAEPIPKRYGIPSNTSCVNDNWHHSVNSADSVHGGDNERDEDASYAVCRIDRGGYLDLC